MALIVNDNDGADDAHADHADGDDGDDASVAGSDRDHRCHKVCWPRGQPEGLDLSVLRTVIKSNGVMLFSRTLRLSKRFGDKTDFVEGRARGLG